MKHCKRVLLIVCALVCAMLLSGFAGASAQAASESEEPLSTLHLEKNGKEIDLTLKKLEIEDGKLAISIGVDGIKGWGEEAPPKMQIIYKEPSVKFKTDVFTTDTVKSLPDSVKNYKMSTKFPVDSKELPDQILIFLDEDEPLVFWPQETETEDAAAGKDAAGKSIEKKDDTQNAKEQKSQSSKEDDKEAEAALAAAKELLEKGEYYEAALAIRDCGSDYPDTQEACGKLWDELEETLAGKRPETKILERTTEYEGRNELHVEAKTGDLCFTAKDTKSGRYVRFYVRQGDTLLVYLPSGTYELSCDIGDLWFDDENGFGYLGVPVTWKEPLDFKTTSDNAWVTFSVYNVTI